MTVFGDVGRSNCYIFQDYAKLLADDGIGYNDDHQQEISAESTKGSYVQKTGADGKAALQNGSTAWEFDTTNNAIKLCGTVVWQAE